MKKKTIIILFLVSVMFVLSLGSDLFAQGFEDLKGVILRDGTVIHGKVIESNIRQVIIEKKDGNRVSVKFDDVSNFLKDEQIAENSKELTAKKSGILASSEHISEGPYMSVNFGISLLNDADVKDVDPKGTIEADPGFTLGAAVGYGFDYGRVEAEISYQKYELDKVRVAGFEVGLSGDASNLALLINGYLDFKNETALTPYLSAGIGVAKVEISKLSIPGIPDLSTSKSYDDTVFAYQVGAGFGFAVTEKVTIDLKYRYYGTSDPKFEDAKVTNSSNNIYIGIRYSF